MKSKRQKHSGAFKTKVAIEALQERETLSELQKSMSSIQTKLPDRKKSP